MRTLWSLLDDLTTRALVPIAAALSVVACSSGDDGSGGSYVGSSTTGDPTTGSSGSGSSSGGSQCDQFCADSFVAFGIDHTGHLLYNQNIAGVPGPTYDKTGPCPAGGTAHVTGTANTADNGVTTLDLTFDLVGCKASDQTYTLTLDGQLDWYGSFTKYEGNSITFTSPSMSVAGTVLVLDQPAVSYTCPISVADTWNWQPDDEGWLNGSICDRPVSM